MCQIKPDAHISPFFIHITSVDVKWSIHKALEVWASSFNLRSLTTLFYLQLKNFILRSFDLTTVSFKSKKHKQFTTHLSARSFLKGWPGWEHSQTMRWKSAYISIMSYHRYLSMCPAGRSLGCFLLHLWYCGCDHLLMHLLFNQCNAMLCNPLPDTCFSFHAAWLNQC